MNEEVDEDPPQNPASATKQLNHTMNHNNNRKIEPLHQ